MLAVRKILVPVDRSPGSAEALRLALALRRDAGRIAAGAALTVFEAIPDADTAFGDSPPSGVAHMRRRSVRERVAAFIREVAPDAQAVDVEVDEGEPRVLVPARAREVDLVVIGAHGRSAGPDLAPGGVAEAAVRRSRTPVLVARTPRSPGARFASKEIVFATDLTPFSIAALRYALAIAYETGARVTAVHVIAPWGKGNGVGRDLPPTVAEEVERFYEEEVGWRRDELGRFLHDLSGASRPVDVCASVLRGLPDERIAELCEAIAADLLVVATHGRSGLRRAVLGSVAEGALRLATCPVLCVHPESGEAAPSRRSAPMR